MQVSFELYEPMQNSRPGVAGERFGLTFVPQVLDPFKDGQIENNWAFVSRAPVLKTEPEKTFASVSGSSESAGER